MFNDIGKKIQNLASISASIGIGVFVIIGIVMMSISTEAVGIAILVMAVGGLVSWVSCFFIYGFGKLIENSEILVSRGHNLETNNSKLENKTEKMDLQLSKSVVHPIVSSDKPEKVETKPEVVYPKIKIRKLESNSVCKKCFVPFAESDNFCSKCGSTEHYVWRSYYGKTCQLCKVDGCYVSSVVQEIDGVEEIRQICAKCINENT